ncbi:MAG: ThiF family adenylyltransferase [Anaerolineales bacterium]|nr:ThiF family adenylyltransferase [Anaerolineales bacterium]MCB0011031.1 ThiF family adenylyltransferase [Anaerolineales bacterium]MCB0016894.1 ThiF family adenylyltransferase [Anaerolineales bacterium]MCB8961120.1 ThiF family adenylyltransferase [Ardenticatenales bacterium]
MTESDAIEQAPIVITDPDSDRYHTFGYISWWQQEVVRNATALVVGAGAIGNEVLKNLTLMGIGNILVADFDTIEDGNLSRSVLFRSSDRGRRKVDAAAERIKELNPDVKVKTWHGNINFEMGLGVFRHADVIIGCLDNREARLSINRFAYSVGRPWVDGAIQELMGIVRTFQPGTGACYECTLTDRDYQLINLRYSCPLLARENILQGKVPTTPTSASIVAAFEAQEALKLIHDMEVVPGNAMMINGLTNDIYNTEYPVKEDCPSCGLAHIVQPVVELSDMQVNKTTVGELLAYAKEQLGPETVLEFGGELVTTLNLDGEQDVKPIFKKMARLTESELDAPDGGRYDMNMTHRITGTENWLDRTLAEIDVPPMDILRARNGDKRLYLELTGDKEWFWQFS